MTQSPPPGLMRWLTSTNHKDIGTLYLLLSLIMFFVAGGMALLMRAELYQPGEQLMNPDRYNQLLTLHGLIMIFGAVMPAFTGLGNWMVPLMIGAPDMALPRLNNFSFWLLVVSLLLLISTLLMPESAPNFGWTFYAPLSVKGPASTDYFILFVHLSGIASLLAAINMMATIVNMRTPGMGYMQMPIFVWTNLITSFLLIAVMPVLATVVTMLLFDRHFGTSFFHAAGGGDPRLFQHIFWFFGHPEVYIMILPAFGIVSEILPTFARKRLFGYTSMVYATCTIAVLSFFVWAHHMFTSGIPLVAELFFMYLTMIIAVPTGIKVFNWVATIFQGSLSFEAPMLFALGFVVMFTIGGLSGLMLAIVPADFQYHDSYFVVAHFHYVLVPGAVFGIFAAAYYWFPKWSGYQYSPLLSQLHFWLSTISVNLTFFPMHFAGLAGMPRRIPDYSLQFIGFNQVATIGGMAFGFSQLLFVYVLLKALWKKVPAADSPWEGAYGLEWTVASPAPWHTFETPPPWPINAEQDA